ncbi:Dr family adhesin structural subunit [Escherichia coli]|nr:Dr family adhesin structural subunit [Escherichia coli]
MKKLAIIGATSVMMMTGTAQANFTNSGTNGKVDLTITGECHVTVESKSESFSRSNLVTNKHITSLGIQSTGCGTGQHVALKLGAGSYDDTDGAHMTHENGTEKLLVKMGSATGDGIQDGGVYYINRDGDWRGQMVFIVRNNQQHLPTGKYTLNLEGGFWTK